MKQIITIATIIIFTSIISADEIGIRGNFGTNSGGELSYRKGVSRHTLLHLWDYHRAWVTG